MLFWKERIYESQGRLLACAFCQCRRDFGDAWFEQRWSNATGLGGFQLTSEVEGMDRESRIMKTGKESRRRRRKGRAWQRAYGRTTTGTVGEHMSRVEKRPPRWGESKVRLD